MMNRRDMFGATVAVAVAVAPVASAAVSPDAHLIELGRSYAALHTQYMRASEASSEAYYKAKNDLSRPNPVDDAAYAACEAREDALYKKVCALEHTILRTPCSTMEGLRVKALVAHNNREPDDMMDLSEKAAFAVVDYVMNGGMFG